MNETIDQLPAGWIKLTRASEGPPHITWLPASEVISVNAYEDETWIEMRNRESMHAKESPEEVLAAIGRSQASGPQGPVGVSVDRKQALIDAAEHLEWRAEEWYGRGQPGPGLESECEFARKALGARARELRRAAVGEEALHVTEPKP